MLLPTEGYLSYINYQSRKCPQVNLREATLPLKFHFFGYVKFTTDLAVALAYVFLTFPSKLYTFFHLFNLIPTESIQCCLYINEYETIYQCIGNLLKHIYMTENDWSQASNHELPITSYTKVGHLKFPFYTCYDFTDLILYHLEYVRIRKCHEKLHCGVLKILFFYKQPLSLSFTIFYLIFNNNPSLEERMLIQVYHFRLRFPQSLIFYKQTGCIFLYFSLTAERSFFGLT